VKFRCAYGVFAQPTRKADDMIVLAGIIAFWLLIYLMVALLKPEWF
jgi:K+-transporting ATPase KdpF subunit